MFFKDAAEPEDPIQGALGDCWLIAALSAVTWAIPKWYFQRPARISSHELKTTPSDIGINSEIPFWDKPAGRTAPSGMVDISNKLCVYPGTSILIYCRSSDSGELWPAIWEKAFAKWSTKDASDFPDMGSLAGGDPIAACAQLTNRNPVHYSNQAQTADQIYNIVNMNCTGQKTFNPMTAWTYWVPEPKQPNYDFYYFTNIAANHAYTIMGCFTDSGKKFIVLRNPWGWFEPPPERPGLNTPRFINPFEGTVRFLDSTYWRPIQMLNPDGIFALEVSDFKKYYGGFGVAV